VIRVVLAEDQALVRAGLRAILDRQEHGIQVVAEAGDGEEALQAACEHRPDVVLMDIRMPRLDGMAATRRITGNQRLADVKVIVLTTFDLDEYIYDALRAGASGFLLKDAEPVELIHGVRTVAKGDALLAASITRRLIERFVRRPARLDPSRRLHVLTPREIEVMTLVAEGLSNDEIAQRLMLSPATAKTHVSHIMTKLNARDRAQVVITAYESALITPSWLAAQPLE
jgi:DNA-binding NarL/FixJ family response regulator